jgi:hypothetical protein
MMDGWMVDRRKEVGEAARLAERTVELGRDDAIALSSAGTVRLRVVGDFETSAALIVDCPATLDGIFIAEFSRCPRL